MNVIKWFIECFFLPSFLAMSLNGSNAKSSRKHGSLSDWLIEISRVISIDLCPIIVGKTIMNVSVFVFGFLFETLSNPFHSFHHWFFTTFLPFSAHTNLVIEIAPRQLLDKCRKSSRGQRSGAIFWSIARENFLQEIVQRPQRMGLDWKQMVFISESHQLENCYLMRLKLAQEITPP